MSAKLKFVAAIGLAPVSIIASFKSADRSINAQDRTVSALVERWAISEGRHSKWEAAVDLPIVDADGINQAAKLADASSMSNAVDRLFKTVSMEGGDKQGAIEPRDMGFFACSYATGKVAMVIRSRGQPGCGAPA